MENLVKYILNFNSKTATKTERNDFVSQVCKCAMSELSNTDKFNNPDDVEVEICKTTGDYGSYCNGTLYLDRDLFFSYNQEDIYFLISVIGHEICHHMQNYYKLDEDKEKNIENISYFNDHFECLVKEMLKILGYRKNANNTDNLGDVYKEHPYITDVMEYLESFYYLQKHEFEAFEFEESFMEKIVKTAESMTLNRKEMGNLEKLKKAYEKVVYLMSHSELERFKKIRNSKKHIVRTKMLTSKVVNRLTNEHLEVISYFNHLKPTDREYKRAIQIIKTLCRTLEINYSNKLAHKLLNVLMKSPQTQETKDLIIDIFTLTKIKLNALEKINFKHIANLSSQDLIYVNEDKERLQAHKNELAGSGAKFL